MSGSVEHVTVYSVGDGGRLRAERVAVDLTPIPDDQMAPGTQELIDEISAFVAGLGEFATIAPCHAFPTAVQCVRNIGQAETLDKKRGWAAIALWSLSSVGRAGEQQPAVLTTVLECLEMTAERFRAIMEQIADFEQRVEHLRELEPPRVS